MLETTRSPFMVSVPPFIVRAAAAEAPVTVNDPPASTSNVLDPL